MTAQEDDDGAAQRWRAARPDPRDALAHTGDRPRQSDGTSPPSAASPTLHLDAVVDAAIELADDEGLAAAVDEPAWRRPSASAR